MFEFVIIVVGWIIKSSRRIELVKTSTKDCGRIKCRMEHLGEIFFRLHIRSSIVTFDKMEICDGILLK